MKKQTVWIFALEVVFCEEKYSPYCHGVGATYAAGYRDMCRIALDDVQGLFCWLPNLTVGRRRKTVKALTKALKSFDDSKASHRRLATFELKVFGWEAAVRQRP